MGHMLFNKIIIKIIILVEDINLLLLFSGHEEDELDFCYLFIY
jgi:hypothetical protein